MSWRPEDGDISEDDGSDMDFECREDALEAQAEARAERQAEISEEECDRAEDAYLDNLHGRS
jgi:hypothetical protein